MEFLRESRAEFKKVEWPSRKEAIRLTLSVIGVSFGVGLFIFVLDYAFKNILLTVLR